MSQPDHSLKRGDTVKYIGPIAELQGNHKVNASLGPQLRLEVWHADKARFPRFYLVDAANVVLLHRSGP